MSKIFLEKNIIDSMDSKSKGPILRSMAIFTAIELFGSFLTGETGEHTTKKNFLKFCESEYMPSKYHEISELLYSIFRCGVSHSYIPKGAALLSGSEKDYHLCFAEKGLCIYVPQLAEDVTEAVKNFNKDLRQNDELQNNYCKVLCKLDKEGKRKYLEFIEKHGKKTQKIRVHGDINVRL
jgi:hypothetical protein